MGPIENNIGLAQSFNILRHTSSDAMLFSSHPRAGKFNANTCVHWENKLATSYNVYPHGWLREGAMVFENDYNLLQVWRLTDGAMEYVSSMDGTSMTSMMGLPRRIATCTDTFVRTSMSKRMISAIVDTRREIQTGNMVRIFDVGTCTSLMQYDGLSACALDMSRDNDNVLMFLKKKKMSKGYSMQTIDIRGSVTGAVDLDMSEGGGGVITKFLRSGDHGCIFQVDGHATTAPVRILSHDMRNNSMELKYTAESWDVTSSYDASSDEIAIAPKAPDNDAKWIVKNMSRSDFSKTRETVVEMNTVHQSGAESVRMVSK